MIDVDRYPPEDIVPALTHHNRQASRYAAMMLGVRQDDEPVPFLATLLRSDSVPARRAAAHALGAPAGSLLAPDRAAWSTPTIDRLSVESLTVSLADADDLVRANSARSLASLCRFGNATAQHEGDDILDLLRSDAVVRPVIHALEDPAALVRIEAATSLSQLAILATLPALIPLFQDLDPEVRASAAFAAGNLGAPQSLPVLLEILSDGPRDARRQAASSLRRVGEPEVVPALMDALADANIMVEECRSLREALVTALGSLGDRQAVPAIIRVLDDHDRHVSDAPVRALAQLGGPQAEDAMISIVNREMYGDRPDSAIRQVIRGLGRMGSVRAMPILRLVIEDGHQQWAPLAARAPRQLGDGITAGDMVEWVSSPSSDDRLRAVLVLPQLVGRDALPQLRRAPGDHDATVRAEAARQLGWLGDRSVVPFLTDGLKDEDDEVRRAACAALDFLAEHPGNQLLERG